MVVAFGIAIGTQADSIKSIWVWMLAGVIGATLIPNVLRWHWWRFNGWGYAAGIFGGLGTACVFGMGQTLHWFGALDLPEYVYAPVIWMASLAGCLSGSLLTAATPIEVLKTFYTRVRPFGFWKPVRAVSGTLEEVTVLSAVVFNVVLGAAALISSYLSVFFLVGHYFAQFSISAAVVLLCAVMLYYGWYKRLPTLCPE